MIKKNKKLYCIFGMGLLGFVTFFVSYLCSMSWLKVTQQTVVIDDLPEEFDGFRILFISDLHSNNYNKMNIDIWSEIEKLDFDIAVITGDIIQSNKEQLLPHEEKLKELVKKVPVFFVDGNHERFIYNGITGYLKSLGITVLNNQKVQYIKNNSSIDIIGFRDYYYLSRYGFPDIDNLIEDSGDSFKLILEHQPQLFDKIKKHGNMLMLSGHTHGGQVRIPFFPVLYAPGQGIFPKYGYGLYTEKDANLFITQGIGATNFNLRLFNRPEICVIELKKRDLF